MYNIINYKLSKLDAQGTHIRARSTTSLSMFRDYVGTPFYDTKKPVCCSKNERYEVLEKFCTGIFSYPGHRISGKLKLSQITKNLLQADSMLDK